LLAKNPIIELKSIVEVNAVHRSVQRRVLSLFTSGGSLSSGWKGNLSATAPLVTSVQCWSRRRSDTPQSTASAVSSRHALLHLGWASVGLG